MVQNAEFIPYTYQAKIHLSQFIKLMPEMYCDMLQLKYVFNGNMFIFINILLFILQTVSKICKCKHGICMISLKCIHCAELNVSSSHSYYCVLHGTVIHFTLVIHSIIGAIWPGLSWWAINTSSPPQKSSFIKKKN